jgi:hypothetical protein
MLPTRSLGRRRRPDRKDGTHKCGDMSDMLTRPSPASCKQAVLAGDGCRMWTSPGVEHGKTSCRWKWLATSQPHSLVS